MAGRIRSTNPNVEPNLIGLPVQLKLEETPYMDHTYLRPTKIMDVKEESPTDDN